MKKFFLVSLIMLTNISFFGQKTKNWKEITPEDFSINTFEDASVHAIILSENVRYYFDVWNEQMRLMYEVTRKIKIIDEQGIKYTNFDIFYHGYENFENIYSLQGVTYLNENGEIKAYKLKKKNQENKKINDYIYQRSVTMPNVKPGAVIVYKYTISSLDIVKPKKIEMQHDIPTIKSVVELNIPEFFKYQMRIIGSQYLSKNQITKSSKYLNFVFHVNSPLPYARQYYRNGETVNAFFDYQLYNYLFEMNNIPAKIDYNFMDFSENYVRGIELNLHKAEVKKGLTSNTNEYAWVMLTRGLFTTAELNYPLMRKATSSYWKVPLGFTVYYVDDWQKTDAFLMKYDKFGLQLIKAWNFKPELDIALKDVDENPFDKMLAIYDYVRTNYKWNGVYSLFLSNEIDKVSKLKIGNSADINSVLISLLKHANFDVSPVVLKTKDKGHFLEDVPSIIQLNHLIAAVDLNNKRYFLDAIHPENPWYILDSNDLNLEGRIIKRLNSEFVEIKPNIITSENNYLTIDLIGNEAKCVLKSDFSGVWAFETSNSLLTYFDSFKNRIKNVSSFENTFEKLNNETGKFSTKIDVKCVDYFIDNEIFPFKIFDLTCFFLNPIRYADLYFGYPFEKKYYIEIRIPSGKKIVSKPESFSKQIDGAKFDADIKIDTNIIKVELNISVKKSLFRVDEYNSYRDLYLSFCNFISTPIVFE